MRTSLLSVLIAFVILIGCSSPDEPKVFMVEPASGISFKFKILEMIDPSYSRKQPENRYQGMNYKLTLTNNTGQQIYFNPGNVIIRINGVENVYTGPQGLGSGEWSTRACPTGSTVFNSYTVFPEELVGVKIEDIRTFSMEASGLKNSP